MCKFLGYLQIGLVVVATVAGVAVTVSGVLDAESFFQTTVRTP